MAFETHSPNSHAHFMRLQLFCLTLLPFFLLPFRKHFLAFDLFAPAIEAYLAVFGDLLCASEAIHPAFETLFPVSCDSSVLL